MFRRGRITFDEADHQLDDIDRETATLRGVVESIWSQAALAEAAKAKRSDALKMLVALRDEDVRSLAFGDAVGLCCVAVG